MNRIEDFVESNVKLFSETFRVSPADVKVNFYKSGEGVPSTVAKFSTKMGDNVNSGEYCVFTNDTILFYVSGKEPSVFFVPTTYKEFSIMTIIKPLRGINIDVFGNYFYPNKFVLLQTPHLTIFKILRNFLTLPLNILRFSWEHLNNRGL